MHILITGVEGFIGSHLARLALQEGNHVTGIARSYSSMGARRIRDIRYNERFSLRHQDLAVSASGVTEGKDIVFHLAAATFVDHSIRDPTHFVRNNIIAAFNVFEDARRHGVRRLVQVSTDEVYGPTAGDPFQEGSPMSPSNPYAATKGAADLMLRAFHTSYGVPGLVVRLSNVFGCHQHPQKVIPTFVRHALADEPLPVFGDGQHLRAWIAVEDVCSGLMILSRRGEDGQVYHLASRDEVTNLDLGQRILKLLGKPLDRIRLIRDRDCRPGHDRRYALDSSLARTLGWVIRHPLVERLPEVAGWYQSHPEWLRS